MSTPPELSTAWRVLAAPLATSGALAVQLLLVPRPTSAPFVLFFAAVAIASWLGGRVAGLVSVAASAVVASFVFVDPVSRSSSSHLATTALFMASAAVVSVFCASLRHSAIEAERKRGEAALRTSEEKFAKAFHGNSAAMVLTRLDDGTFLDVNARWLQLMGYTRDEALARSPRVRVWKDPAAREEFVAALRKHGEVTNEYQLLRKSGEEWTARLSSQLTDIDGEKVIVTSIIDVTERNRVEQIAKESEQKYAAIHDHAPLAISLSTLPDGEIVDVNEAFVSLFGFARAECLGKTAPQLGIVGDSEARASLYASVLEHGVVRDREMRYRTRTGQTRICAVSVNVVALGGKKHSLAVLHDITDRKLAEERVLRSREGLRRLAEASLDVIRERELDGLRTAIVEGARKLTGARSAAYLRDEAESAPGAPALRAPMLDGRGHLRGTIVVRGAESGAFAEEDGALVAQLATVASLALDHVEARLSLEEADRRKDDFLAMLSHELRNPLAPIRNSLHVLDRAQAGSERARRAHVIIDRQIEHMTKLVDDLLDVTRISRGKVQLETVRLDLRETVRRVVDDHREAFARAGVAVELDLGGPTWVEADPTRVAQIVGNLLANAVKFTDAGGSTRISLDDEHGEAVLRVRDTGVGIAASILGHVFEAFTQADTTLDRSKGGLGLGLALVKGLTEMHGGRVAARSEGVGRGAEIEVRLPLAVSERGTKTSPPPAAPSMTRRVLVIEDNVDAAETLRMVLELEGHQVQVAFSGPEGVARAKDLAPDLVLCDIGLPGMDGYAVARELRSDPRLSGVRIVALTGYASPEDRTRATSAGFDDHLAKPPDLASLGRILAELPGRHAA